MSMMRSGRAAAGAATLLATLAVALASGAGAARAENAVGAWPQPTATAWPLIPIHAVLMPDGRVLTYGSGYGIGTITEPATQTGRFWYDIWNPSQGLAAGHLTLPNTTLTDLFCSAQLVLSRSADVLLLGGDNWSDATHSTNNRGNNSTSLLGPANGYRLTTGSPMQRKRWYATATMLPDGNIYVQGGLDGQDRPEVRLADGSSRLLSAVDTSALRWWYPRNFLAPSGRIFGWSDRTMYLVDTAGLGRYTPAGTLPWSGPSGVTSTAVMYAPGRILSVGGGATGSSGGGDGKGTAVTIDINSGTPVVRAIDPLPGGVGLHWLTATVIADGRVVVTGGSRVNNVLPADPVAGIDYNVNAYIWNPKGGPASDPGRGAWTKGAATGSQKARLYHAVALLLPDGTVFVGGGGAPGPQDNNNAEIYRPPYLLDGAARLMSRPTIRQVTSLWTIGQPLQLSVDRAVQRVTLLRTGSVTHSFDMDQRFMELSFTRGASDPLTLTVNAPASAKVAPPGWYLVFVIDAQGVPSVGKIVRLRRA